MAEVTTEQQLKDAQDKSAILEAQLKASQEELRDTTTESMKRKGQLNEFKVKDEQRNQQEQEAHDKAEQERLATLPGDQRQYEEMNSLVKGLHDVINKQNQKIDGLVIDVQASSKQSVERQKAAAVAEILGGMNFHNNDHVKKFIDLDEVPTKNGEPDKGWIQEKAAAIATDNAYLLKPPPKTMPNFGPTSPPNPEPMPAPGVVPLTPEQRGVNLVEKGLVDPKGALIDALSATPGIDEESAMYKAFNTPT